MKYVRIGVLILFLASGLSAETYKLELVKSIGDEREDYTFFQVSSIVMSENKDIYVADKKGHFIAKYKWDGTFVKRVGNAGAGPGDFGDLRNLDIYKDRLYAYDFGNTRIAELGMDLDILDYIKLNTRFFRFAFPLDENHFMGDRFLLLKDMGRIRILNRKGVSTAHFFDKTPIGRDFNWKDRKKLLGLTARGTLMMNISPDRETVLVSFTFCNNPLDFYVYTTGGEQLKHFTYKADDKFGFPPHFLDYQKRPPERYYFLLVYSVFFHGDGYLVFYEEYSQLGKEKSIQDYFCLIFNRSGELLQRIKLDRTVRFSYLSPEGYLAGADPGEDDGERIVIYRLREGK